MGAFTAPPEVEFPDETGAEDDMPEPLDRLDIAPDDMALPDPMALLAEETRELL